jgi:ribosome recycling factor
MTLNNIYQAFEEEKTAALDRLQEDLATLRTGRVTTRLVEGILVEQYGALTPLNGLASITASDARSLVIAPWDPNTITAIKKSLTDAQLGAQPMDDGKVVRLVFASLTEENRKQALKILGEYMEQARVRLRKGRDEALRQLKTAKQEANLTEDDFYAGKEKLDQLIDEANKEVASWANKKEEEIVTL